MGLSDLRGIQEVVALHWGNDIYGFKPGVESDEVIQKGISTRILIPPSSNEPWDFSLDLSINGSTSLSMVPLGKSTLVELKSSWPSPSDDHDSKLKNHSHISTKIYRILLYQFKSH